MKRLRTSFGGGGVCTGAGVDLLAGAIVASGGTVYRIGELPSTLGTAAGRASCCRNDSRVTGVCCATGVCVGSAAGTNTGLTCGGAGCCSGTCCGVDGFDKAASAATCCRVSGVIGKLAKAGSASFCSSSGVIGIDN